MGQWVEEPEFLKQMARDFYRTLYEVESCPVLNVSGWRFPSLNHSDSSWLNRGVSNDEIRKVVFGMNGGKALGREGFSPVSFRIIWKSLATL